MSNIPNIERDVENNGDLHSVSAVLIDSGNPAADCKAFLHQVSAELAEAFSPNEPIKPLLKARAEAVDSVMRHLWQQSLADEPRAMLAAVGGYGRGELYPQSDIDLLFLLQEEPSAELGEHISSMLQALWDLGLRIGQSVRLVSECRELAEQDLTIFTTMLEARHLAGNAALLDALNTELARDKVWDSAAFFSAKQQETVERHERFANTEFNIEPNVKNGPGGLRDIQVIGWVARRHYGVALHQLSADSFLTAEERRMLEAGENFIGQVRFALHMISGREEDRLLLDHQRKLAALWEMVDGEKLAVEQFMQVYYRWTKSINQLSELLMQIYDWDILHSATVPHTQVLDDDFELQDDLLAARHADVFTQRPANLLRAFVVMANDERIQGIAPETWRLLRSAKELIDGNFRAQPEHQELFMALLRSPFGVTKQLRRMASHGILGRYLPEFGKIIGQMQFDLFHAYTVDAHTLAVLANTRRFKRADYTDRFPVSTRIAQRLRKPELLYIAALYHDIGKGRGGDHSELGAVDALGFCQRHNLDARDTELIVWLVRNHLVMSSISQRKDISDPEEILRFASHVVTEERLDYLYTLTVADIDGTNPELWNAWRSSLLRQLYTETRRALRRGLENPIAREDVVTATKKATADLLESRGFLDSELEEIWDRRGDDYFLRERPGDIAWHTEVLAELEDPSKPLVLVRQASDSSVANATQIFVHAPDKPDLFTRICVAIESLELSVHDARVYSGNDGATLDTFYVLRADGRPIADTELTLERIRAGLQKAMESEQPRAVSRRMPRQLKSFLMPTETQFSHDLNRDWTVLELATPDRPGLLARIGQVFSDQSIAIQGAKIQTLGERVEDVFFITDYEGHALPSGERLNALSAALSEALDDSNEATL